MWSKAAAAASIAEPIAVSPLELRFVARTRAAKAAAAAAVGNAGPADRDRDLVRVGPFEHERLDPAGHGGDGVDQLRRLEGARDAVMLQR